MTPTQPIQPTPTNTHKTPCSASWRQRAIAIGAVLALQISSGVQAADLSQQMASMFGNGAMANVTGPGAYKSQTQGVYAGGEMQLRFPARNYQLWSLSLPSIKFGCGGADVYLGSFSHIKGEQFKQMLEEVSRAYIMLTFKAALKSINPLIESVLGDMQKTLESFSQYGGNTCAMAQAAVDATSQYTGMNSQNSCVSMAMQLFGDDPAAASRRCKVETASTNTAAKNSADAKIKAMAERDINLIWEALSGSTLSVQEKEVILNIAGTIILYKPSNTADEEPAMPKPFEPSIDSLRTLLNGNGPGTNADEVVIANWLKCPDSECLSPTSNSMAITPFPVLVRQMLETIRDRVVNRQALRPAEINFVNMTTVPIYRMIAVGYTNDSASGGQDLADLLIHRYAKVIAYDYAYAYMRAALKDVRLYTSMALVKGRVEQEQRDKLIQRVERLMDQVDAEHSRALTRVREARGLIDDLQAIERDMRASLPTSIRNMQDIGNLIKGGKG